MMTKMITPRVQAETALPAADQVLEGEVEVEAEATITTLQVPVTMITRPDQVPGAVNVLISGLQTTAPGLQLLATGAAVAMVAMMTIPRALAVKAITVPVVAVTVQVTTILHRVLTVEAQNVSIGGRRPKTPTPPRQPLRATVILVPRQLEIATAPVLLVPVVVTKLKVSNRLFRQPMSFPLRSVLIA
jgi:hypothetical protein